MGRNVGENTPEWMHPILHLVLFWGPIALVLVITLLAIRAFRNRIRKTDRLLPTDNVPKSRSDAGAFTYIVSHSKRDQVFLALLGFVSLPILYVTLELPKLIINRAIGSDNFPVSWQGYAFDQAEYLWLLSGMFLVAMIAHGSLKYFVNVYKGKLGERILRRLRLNIFRAWYHARRHHDRSELIPIVAQEVEPIGGFASEIISLPVFQGGTFLTIVIFMFIQDPILGASALSLLPVQLYLIPKLQKRLNRLVRNRMTQIRDLSSKLGDISYEKGHQRGGIRATSQSFKDLQLLRHRIYRTKFLMKALNNFLTSLTPFLFYAIGGYLVIAGQLSLGALVAVLAAYKDFSSPLRELFRYYQSAEDVRVRFKEIQRFLNGGNIFLQRSALSSEKSEVMKHSVQI